MLLLRSHSFYLLDFVTPIGANLRQQKIIKTTFQRQNFSTTPTCSNKPSLLTELADQHQKRYLSTTQCLQASSMVFQNARPTTSIQGYFITLPNVPNESSENNVFLDSIAQNKKWPPFQSATPEEFYEGTVKLILDYGASVWEQLDLLENDLMRAEKGDPNVPKRTFNNTVYSLIIEENDVFYAKVTLLVKMITDWPDCDQNFFNEDLMQIEKTFKRELTERWMEDTWIEAVKQAYDNEANVLESWQRRYLEWMILQARLSGKIRQNDKKAEKKQDLHIMWNNNAVLFAQKYLHNIIQDSGTNVMIRHRHLLRHAPPRVLYMLSSGDDPEKGPWEVTSTNRRALFWTLKYCSAPEIRQQLWDAHVNRSSFAAERLDLNNSMNIEEIRHNYEGFAKALGFKSTAHHKTFAKMAGNPQTVRTFVDQLYNRLRPVFLDRLEVAWKNYVEEQEQITVVDLGASDIYYLSNREAEFRYDANFLLLMRHFPLWPTFERMLQMSSKIFNIDFRCVDNDKNVERCHPSVRIFDVTDKATGERLGYLYVDAFSRENKRLSSFDWITELGRPANKNHGLDTLVYMIGNLPEHGYFLYHDDLGNMLAKFGKALQLLFSRSPCYFLAKPMYPYLASDFDANGFLPSFLRFCMFKPQLLQDLSSPHEKTGKSLSIEQATMHVQAMQRATFWEAYRTLFWTDFDLTIHNMSNWDTKFWHDLYKEMYADYFPTFKEKNFHPCSFEPIFGEMSVAGLYYRALWGEMLALDVHNTFDQENNVRVTGDRLKAKWLNYGATELQSELFNRFQGRDPSVTSILNFYDPEYLANH